MPPKRRVLTIEALRENNITIFHKPDKSHWPDYVRKLESKLVSSFAGLIPESVLEEEISWGPTGLPSDAIDLSTSGRAKMKPKEEKFEFAQEVNRECQEILESETDNEESWCNIWREIFHKILIKGKRGQTSHLPFRLVVGKQFTKTTPELLFDVQKCQLTRPTPDYTLGFTTFCHTTNDADGHKKNKCFDQVILDKLLNDPNNKVLSSPFGSDKKLCFPWAIFEGKSISRVKTRAQPFAECQAVNAGVKCLRILEKLKKSASLHLQGHSRKERMAEALPIPCFTCHGGEWYLWICYRSGYNHADGMPTYNLDKVFEGNMNEMWSCMQLLHIIENLKNWALDIFKPWVNEHLSACIQLMNLNRKKTAHFTHSTKPLRQNRCLSPHRDTDDTDENEYSDRDSAIVINYKEEKDKVEYKVEPSPSPNQPPEFLSQGRMIEFYGGSSSEDDASQTEEEFNDSGFVDDTDEFEEEEYKGTNKREEQMEKKPGPIRRSDRIRHNPKYENFSYRE